MTDKRGFDEYFANRGQLTGLQPTAGDEILVLRGGTVFRGSLTYNKAIAGLNNNVSPTTILTADAFADISGTWLLDSATPAFSFTLGEFTYSGVDQIEPAMLMGFASMQNAGSGAIVAEIAIFVNDIQVGIGMQTTVTDTGVTSVSVATMKTLYAGDTIKLNVRNRTDTQSIIVADAQLVINQ